ncbi:D-TA family PLP-dependent enzyme [Pseudarthrobacter sp. AB1]|uniref:D-TA family PLP-dependent enzyme n=1 Tax=Pseudarthrobacter sp. AB1 TaxID=2138309 RepID=UPI00186B7065|nr:D-TA family PLP-dependent enzyme [Pseudarthrobacter sp. AB1]MBE4718700.1 alanine racemase [Pseudarthrobacter sp. AB1]
MTIPAEIDTPEIIIDRDVLQRNIDRMATAVRAKGLHLRPHVKTHKVPEIAEMQLAAGAVGLTVATLGEAEVFAEHGAKDIFIAYPLWVGPRQAERLRRLAAKARIAVGLDSREAAGTMAASLGGAVGEIEVVLEIDSGHHRSGIAPDAVVGVAQAAARGGLRVTGIFTFPGHSYAPGMPLKAMDEERLALGEAAGLLTAAGFPIAQRSGGSTPTATLTAGDSGATEVRPGVYVFGDAQQLELERCAAEDIALTIAATVVSRHEGTDLMPRRVILDSGSKILGGDRPGWTTGFGRLLDHPEARITALSEHHATVVWPEEATLPALGDRLRVVPNHVCIAMNLVDDVTVVSGGKIVDRWHVAARGRNK